MDADTYAVDFVFIEILVSDSITAVADTVGYRGMKIQYFLVVPCTSPCCICICIHELLAQHQVKVWSIAFTASCGSSASWFSVGQASQGGPMDPRNPEF